MALGATAPAVAAVLATFMLGLALGAIVIGRFGDRVRQPLWLYGWLEIGTAIAALLATALAVQLPVLYAYVSTPIVLLASLCLLLPPTVLMGATLPTLLAYVERAGEGASVAVSRLYAANTAGGLLGAVAAGFLLIESFGLWGAACAGALLNFAAGAGALVLGRVAPTGSPAMTPAGDFRAHVGTRSFARWAALGAFTSGLAVLGYEVLYTRLLIQGFLGTAYSFAVILAAFLAGMAVGAIAIPRDSDTGTLSLGVTLAAGGVMAVGFGPALLMTPDLVEFLRGTDVRFGVRLLIYSALAVTLAGLPAVVWGMSFPLAARLLLRSGRAGQTLGGALLVNTIGAVVGSLATGFWLLPKLGVRGALAVLAAAQVGAGMWLMGIDRAGRRNGGTRRWAMSGTLLGGFVIVLLFGLPPKPGSTLGDGVSVPPFAVGREDEFRLLCHREGVVSTTQVIEETATRRKSLILDGFVTAADGQGTNYMPMMGHLPMLLHPQPRNVLVICFGTGSTARAVASWPEVTLDVAEINPDVLECAPHFSGENRDILPYVHLDDGRTFLLRTKKKYDVITLEPMPPHFAGTVNLYSREYYELAHDRLRPNGVIVQWLPFHLVSPTDSRMIVATMQAVFPETHVWVMPGEGTGLVVGSSRPIDFNTIDRRMVLAPAAFRQLGLDGAGIRAAFALDPRQARAFAGRTPLVTDNHPYLEYSGVDRVLARFRNAAALQAHNVNQVWRVARSTSNQGQ